MHWRRQEEVGIALPTTAYVYPQKTPSGIFWRTRSRSDCRVCVCLRLCWLWDALTEHLYISIRGWEQQTADEQQTWLSGFQNSSGWGTLLPPLSWAQSEWSQWELSEGNLGESQTLATCVSLFNLMESRIFIISQNRCLSRTDYTAGTVALLLLVPLQWHCGLLMPGASHHWDSTDTAESNHKDTGKPLPSKPKKITPVIVKRTRQRRKWENVWPLRTPQFLMLHKQPQVTC